MGSMKMNKSGIYKIISPNNKIYIGQTINFENRCKQYKYKKFNGQIKLWNNCKKYNWNPIDNIELIEECSIDELDEREKYWIKYYNSNATGLNCDEGGKGRRGFKHSEKTKLLLKEKNIGKNHSDETKQKISNSLKNISSNERLKWKTNKGKPLSIDHINKIKESKKLNPYIITDEHRKKISQSNIGNTNMLGKNHSEESKKKISDSKKGKQLNHYRLKKIICVDTGEIFENQQEASKKLGLKISNILRSCADPKRKCNKMKFMYYQDYLDSI